MATTCTKLSRDKVRVAIGKLPARLRRKATRHMENQRRYRHGSDTYGSKHETKAVTDKEREEMHEMHQEGLSFRALEEVFKLYPNSGNDAQRCCREGRKLSTRRKRQRRLATA